MIERFVIKDAWDNTFLLISAHGALSWKKNPLNAKQFESYDKAKEFMKKEIKSEGAYQIEKIFIKLYSNYAS